MIFRLKQFKRGLQVADFFPVFVFSGLFQVTFEANQSKVRLMRSLENCGCLCCLFKILCACLIFLLTKTSQLSPRVIFLWLRSCRVNFCRLCMSMLERATLFYRWIEVCSLIWHQDLSKEKTGERDGAEVVRKSCTARSSTPCIIFSCFVDKP